MATSPPRPTAVFLDRDGTIIVDRHYPARAEEVILLPGAARAVRLLNEAGIPAIAVTNQSGIAQGMVSLHDYARVKARLDELLAAEGARLDATYFCPHHPDFTGPCDCRKPGTGMYEQAARELGIRTDGAMYVGDRLRDVLPSLKLGGHGVLVPSEATPAADLERAQREFSVGASLLEVIEQVLGAAHHA